MVICYRKCKDTLYEGDPFRERFYTCNATIYIRCWLVTIHVQSVHFKRLNCNHVSIMVSCPAVPLDCSCLCVGDPH
jgi:hypothetical protein